MNAYAKSADAYLTQRILAANPEQQAALIMEAGQLHLGKAIQSLSQNDLCLTSRHLYRVSEVISEATARLNQEEGGPLVQRLEKLYEWWAKEVVMACDARDTRRLAQVANQMGEIRQAWEYLHEKKHGSTEGALASFGSQVV